MNLAGSKIEDVLVRAVQGNTVLAISVSQREVERYEKTFWEYGFIHPMVVYQCAEGPYQVIAGECERMVLTRLLQSTFGRW